jgi:hypothetical protein
MSINATHNIDGRKTDRNRSYPKVMYIWLNQSLYFHQSLSLVDSEVIRNSHFFKLRKVIRHVKTTNLDDNY